MISFVFTYMKAWPTPVELIVAVLQPWKYLNNRYYHQDDHVHNHNHNAHDYQNSHDYQTHLPHLSITQRLLSIITSHPLSCNIHCQQYQSHQLGLISLLAHHIGTGPHRQPESEAQHVPPKPKLADDIIRRQ